MSGIKIALSAIGSVLGSAAAVTGGIVANVPAIGGDTPVSLTVALVGGGIGTTAVIAWKVSRAWSGMEATVQRIDDRLKAMEHTEELRQIAAQRGN